MDMEVSLDMEQVSLKELQRAVAKDPGDIESRLLLARRYMEDHAPGKAISLLEQVTRLDPNQAEAWLRMGLCWGMAILENLPPVELWGEEKDEEVMVENALHALEKAIEYDPEMTGAYNAMARIFVIRGQDEEAVELFSQSLQLDPTQLDVVDELKDITGTPAWELLDKETDMGDEEDTF
ncbi:MAG TPA: tetratricopeptide repeat protein [Candidatus Fermentibacter daniensis]|jgi:Tfp pilus assembly protein PilF|nr:MAG: tetratricopeptide repeat protein [candidate division Hyd24-12 bacterium ADurb.Bin004]HOA05545.1 tetratricopeptide repeat protein [Candidatus Fermentibacter daniensis]